MLTHGVSFDEASTVFADPRGKLEFDLEHSDDEDRFIQLGRSNKERLLWVCHCYRCGVIRIISARPAQNVDEIDYFEGD
ncbi:BrnT family toxin [Duganella sp. FT135W]|uniref:BrnT family toxin n=2 Tax=Duganella flavida TaxID=2692175 RepID=A0A6L8KKJ3_9BURK|nr:BrnT family toxin [Duganella flavida]